MIKPPQHRNASSSSVFNWECLSLSRVRLVIILSRSFSHISPEKLQAKASSRADYIHMLSMKHVVHVEGIGSKIQFDLRRARDFQCIAQFMYCCYNLPEPLFPSSPKVDEWLLQPNDLPSAFKAAIERTLGTFWCIADKDTYNMAFTQITQRVAPIEFVFTGGWRGWLV